MERNLKSILEDGTLRDNQSCKVNQGKMSCSSGGVDLEIKSNNKIWNFLTSVSRDFENAMKDKKAKKEALILFNDKDYEHNTDDGFISVTGTDAENFTLDTGNLIGFVKRGDYSLKISSRFGDNFLRHIIADADGFLELENKGGESHGAGYEWLLAYLWSVKFKRAYRLGLPKTYITKNDRISRIRGTIDAIDYYQNSTSGKYLCSYREHSYASPATSLFIKAYETVKHYNLHPRTRGIYNAFLTANQGVKRSHQKMLNTPYFANPFYNDYNTLIDLSKKVISHLGSDFDSQHDSSAFFFDISMLFEYFIRKLIKRSGIRLLDKLCAIPTIPTLGHQKEGHKLIPDLVFEQEKNLYVFDVKYKFFNQKEGVKREDLFQLHTYIGQYGNKSLIKGCGFIYPIPTALWEEFEMDKKGGLISGEISQQGKKIPFYALFLKIPDNKSIDDFNGAMREQCRMFLDTIQSKIIVKE